MLKELFELVKGHATDTVINNPDIPNDKNDDVVAEATNTVASGLRNVVAGGGLENIIALFKGNSSNEQSSVNNLLKNPIVNMMVGHLAGKLMSKYNIGSNQANKVANNLIPGVLGGLISKANSGSGGFSLDGLLNSITGGQVAQQQETGDLNLQDILSKFSGNDNNGGGGGLMDIVTKFAQGAQGQQQKNGGGGLLDLIKGFM